MNRLQTTQAPVTEMWEPYRAPSVHSDVGVPLLQALVGAGLVGLAFGVLLLAAGVTWRTAGPVAGVVCALAAVGMWFWRLHWATGTLEKIESLTGLDLNHDGTVGVHDVVVNGQSVAPRNVQEIWQEKANNFVTWTFKHGTSLRAIRGSGLFTEGEIEKLSSMILRHDLDIARWKHLGDRKSGWGYTCTLEQALERVARIMWIPDKMKQH